MQWYNDQFFKDKMISECTLFLFQLDSKHQHEPSKELWPIGKGLIAFELMDV